VKPLDNEAYLKLMLKDKKLKLEHLHVKHQVNQAIFEAKRDALIEDVNSIEKQLDNKK
jgi:hypothetical protein